jgi:hypothetical protein
MKGPQARLYLKSKEYWDCQFYKTRPGARQAKIISNSRATAWELTPSNLINSLEHTRDKPKRKMNLTELVFQRAFSTTKDKNLQIQEDDARSSCFQLQSSEFNEDS